MTANPDSALRQALVAAEKALRPLAAQAATYNFSYNDSQCGLVMIGVLRDASEAHALITEALQQHNGKKP